MISLQFNADDRDVVAIDTALTVLDVPALTKGMSYGEIEHSRIFLRDLRSRLLRGRAQSLEAVMRKIRNE